jgi:hypothetical protein
MNDRFHSLATQSVFGKSRGDVLRRHPACVPRRLAQGDELEACATVIFGGPCHEDHPNHRDLVR